MVYTFINHRNKVNMFKISRSKPLACDSCFHLSFVNCLNRIWHEVVYRYLLRRSKVLPLWLEEH